MSTIETNYNILIDNLQKNDTPENSWALNVLGIDNDTFLKILYERLQNTQGIVPFNMVICDEQVSIFYKEDSVFLLNKSGDWKHKWNTFVLGMRNYVRGVNFVNTASSVSMDPQLFPSKPSPFTGSVSVGRGEGGGRKSRAKPRRKTNKSRSRRKSIKKLHRRK
jgi:hypothetical protein